MDIIERIVQFFKKPEKETVDKSPQGTCALCWGQQEYDGKIRKLYKDKQIDVNNHKASYMLVQKFVKDNIDGYHIKDGVIHVCPDCSELKEGKDRIKKFSLDASDRSTI